MPRRSFFALFGKRNQSLSARQRPPRVRLRLESLEERLTPAVHDLNTGMTYPTIQAAVNAANPHDTLLADPGTYRESVTVNKPLTLEGAQHGVDARTRSGLESIVDGTTNGGKTPFYVTASDVTIDGFTVQGATSPNQFGFGILLASGTSGAHVVNDIIQNNIVGLGLTNTSSTDPAVIRHDLFRNNIQPGPAGGTDIYADQFTAGAGGVNNVTIDSNTFTNTAFVENAWALGISNTGSTPFTKITFTGNNVTNHGRGVYFYNTAGVLIGCNTITGASHYAIGLFGNNGTPANASFTITHNNLDAQGTGGAGLELVDDTSARAYTGTLNATRNWWGSATGPTTPRNPHGTGSAIIDPDNQVRFKPWLRHPADCSTGGDHDHDDHDHGDHDHGDHGRDDRD
jgi:hypothetical protein